MGNADAWKAAPSRESKVHRLVRRRSNLMLEPQDKNDIRYWLPRVNEATDRIPETWLVAPQSDLRCLLDGEWPEYFGEFLDDLATAGRSAGYPCFLRTGHSSFKHSWSATCFVDSPLKFTERVAMLAENSELAGIMGIPYDVFAVRRMLKTTPLFHAFHGMPITREFRFFVDGGTILCRHPYWPAEAIADSENADKHNWPDLLAASHAYDDADRAAIEPMVAACGAALEGYWSVDVLQAEDGWYVIDCALGADSWHWPGCVNETRSA